MRRRNQPIMYADANSKVGQVRVFACPHCRDGEVTNRLSEQNKLMREALNAIKTLAHDDYCRLFNSQISECDCHRHVAGEALARCNEVESPECNEEVQELEK